MKTHLSILLLTLSLNVYGSTFEVGSNKDYKTPNQLYVSDILQDGDTILIDPELYIGTDALAVWMPNNLVIKGVGGMVRLDAAGQYIWGKGIWVLAGNDITVENIEFFGVTVPDQNGAGIRLDGNGMTVRYCSFHDSDNGILTSNTNVGTVIIEYTEFARNGFGDGQSHNLYIGRNDKLIFRFNYSHHAFIGHNLKSRATENYILYNRIMDEEEGRSSRLIDLSNGGFSIIMGNLFMQGENAENKNLIGYGLEGLTDSDESKLFIINNTLLNKRVASCNFLDVNEETSEVKVFNNIFTGTGEINAPPNSDLGHNLLNENINELLFEDEENYNYTLLLGSPAIDLGIEVSSVDNNSLTPNAIYVHPLSMEERSISNGKIDIGAYEFRTTSSAATNFNQQPTIYPNPVTENLYINSNSTDVINIYLSDNLGKIIPNPGKKVIDMSTLKPGIYYLTIVFAEGKQSTSKIIKH